MKPFRLGIIAASVSAAVISLAVLSEQVPVIAAGGLLYPFRHVGGGSPPGGCSDAQFEGSGVTLRGWRCAAQAIPRGTVIYLHGIADNRSSAAGVIPYFVTHGFDVVTYDSRAHGQSSGKICTYGYFEKHDLRRVIDTIVNQPVILMGQSLGAAVALQAAPDDPRVAAVISVAAFSDLRTIARERAPFFLTDGIVDRAFRYAEARGAFAVDRVSPVDAAAHIKVPVLVIHGKADVETRAAHAERIFAALSGPKRLILVEGATHNEPLSRPSVWREISVWIDEQVNARALLRSDGRTSP